jgi:hypothetical protein
MTPCSSCYSALGPTTTVVTVFAGFPPRGTLGSWDADGGATDSRTRVAERRQEDQRALARSGARFVHLDLPDSQYVTSGAAERPRLQAFTTSLRDQLGSAKTVLAPCALSTKGRFERSRGQIHSDYRFVRDAVLAVHPAATLYADLPYALLPETGGFALPNEVDDGTQTERRLTLDPHLVAEKIEPVRCYATELEQLVDGFGDFLTPSGLGLEVYWEPEP